MRHLNKYLSFARASLRIIFVYRAAFVFNMMGMIFYVFAMFYLWQTIFLGNTGNLGGFTWPEMKAYLLLAFLLSSMLTWYDEWIMGQDVREGRVAIDLARPVDFQAKRMADAFGPVPFEISA
ncbi:MAG: ABC-2 family transporter protein, partial [Candidatus Limnocylindrales bacterium]